MGAIKIKHQKEHKLIDSEEGWIFLAKSFCSSNNLDKISKIDKVHIIYSFLLTFINKEKVDEMMKLLHKENNG